MDVMARFNQDKEAVGNGEDPVVVLVRRRDAPKLGINTDRGAKGLYVFDGERFRVLPDSMTQEIYRLDMNGREIASVWAAAPAWFPKPRLKAWFIRWLINEALRSSLRAA